MPTFADDKTEAPTPRRRKEARTKGQVARSQDLTAAATLFAAFLALRLVGESLFGGLLLIVTNSISMDSPTVIPNFTQTAEFMGKAVLGSLGPFMLAVLATGLLVLLLQVGPLLTFQPLMPSLGKINPINGLKQLFSLKSLVSSLVQVGKFAVVFGVAALSLQFEAASILFASGIALIDLVQLGATIIFELCVQLSGAILIIALLDYAWQRYRHERDLMMTKEEVRDELRSMEGDPTVKRRRRQLQMQMSMQRLQKDVPTSDVVVTNPTHFAVAIRYDAESMMAPKVTAKGADYAALRIRQIASKHGIPIVERKPLARALFETVEVGQYIPERFYKAIAEVLAYVYELTGMSSTMGRDELVGAR